MSDAAVDAARTATIRLVELPNGTIDLRVTFLPEGLEDDAPSHGLAALLLEHAVEICGGQEKFND